MNYLYLLLNIISITIPLLFSFHKKIQFYKHWKQLIVALTISSLLFICWDIIFTVNGVWGFNNSYLVGINILHLPLEEWLFFICIPYACIFTHYTIVKLYPKFELNRNITISITYILALFLLIIAFSNLDKAYTAINFLLGGTVLILASMFYQQILKHYLLTYLIIFIPFLIINGVLTGSFIKNEVVWYNNDENLALRLFTIPIEDTIYAFSLILIPLMIMKKIESSTKAKVEK